jgi:hypothetical protein
MDTLLRSRSAQQPGVPQRMSLAVGRHCRLATASVSEQIGGCVAPIWATGVRGSVRARLSKPLWRASRQPYRAWIPRGRRADDFINAPRWQICWTACTSRVVCTTCCWNLSGCPPHDQAAAISHIDATSCDAKHLAGIPVSCAEAPAQGLPAHADTKTTHVGDRTWNA